MPEHNHYGIYNTNFACLTRTPIISGVSGVLPLQDFLQRGYTDDQYEHYVLQRTLAGIRNEADLKKTTEFVLQAVKDHREASSSSKHVHQHTFRVVITE